MQIVQIANFGSGALWYPSANLDAQLAHVGWGFLLVIVVRFAWRAATKLPAANPAPLRAAILLTLLYATAKEFAFDVLVERDGFRNGAVDFSFYCIGVAGAVALSYGWRRLRNRMKTNA